MADALPASPEAASAVAEACASVGAQFLPWAEIATAWSQKRLTEDQLEHIQPIFRWLNRREFISIGLDNGSVHQPTYADWWGIPFIREWERAEPFLNALRSTDKGDEGLFRKFDELACSERFRQHSQPDGGARAMAGTCLRNSSLGNLGNSINGVGKRSGKLNGARAIQDEPKVPFKARIPPLAGGRESHRHHDVASAVV